MLSCTLITHLYLSFESHHFQIGNQLLTVSLNPQQKERLQAQLAKMTPEQQQLFFRAKQPILVSQQQRQQLQAQIQAQTQMQKQQQQQKLLLVNAQKTNLPVPVTVQVSVCLVKPTPGKYHCLQPTMSDIKFSTMVA